MEQVIVSGTTLEAFTELLTGILRTVVQEELAKLPSSPPAEEKFYTRKEVARRLRISLPTLDSHTKNGFYDVLRKGRRVLYPASQFVKSAINTGG